MYQRFLFRLSGLEEVFTRWVVHAPPSRSDADLMFLEGLISTLWQHWSLFCRRVVFSSAVGCVTRSGSNIPACVAPPRWERVSYVAWRVHSRGRIQTGDLNTNLRLEPTWGDVQKAQDVIRVLSPANAAQLISCLGSVSRGPIDVQLVRNAAAHLNQQTFAAVKGLSLYYNAARIRHPAEVATWTEPTSRDFVFIAWANEMRLLADLMTN